MRALVAGGGIFGVTSALALRRRGHEVTLIDPGSLPHPLAESTDISKIIRLDYGADEAYTTLAERSLAGWRRWNRNWQTPLFHEVGVAYLTFGPMQPGSFEQESFALVGRRGHPLERLDADAIARRYPAFRPGAFTDGYYNPQGGWAESGAVVARLVAEASAAGVVVRGGAGARAVEERGGRATGLVLADGEVLSGDAIVIASGAWSSLLCPAVPLRPAGQAVFHLRPANPALFEPDRFPVFCPDITRTGYYGFPITGGVVKIANHGPGVPVDMTKDERAVPAGEEAAMRAFLADAVPDLAGAELAAQRLCVYGDTPDGHFWIAADPDRAGLVVAAGGSGHAFKFAPVIGDLIADVAVGPGLPSPLAERFGWRPEIADARGEDVARFRGPTAPG
jgi:glycine/D-amino acid oxidase-like deaminating enzyme